MAQPDSAPSAAARRPNGPYPRLTPILYFATAHAALLVALAALVARPAELSGFFYQPRTVALVHLVTLGWITASILGSLYVIGPLALRTPMPEGRADLLVWAITTLGLAGIATHFWIGSYGGVGWSALLVLAGVMHASMRVLKGIRAAPVGSAVKHFLLLANLNFLLAGGLGILLAFDKAHPFLPAVGLGNVFAHAHLAAVGWVGMVVMGTGLRMFPMILPAAMPKSRRAVGGAILTEVGVLGLFGCQLFGSPVAGFFAVCIAGGFGLFLVEIAWMARNLRPGPRGMPRPDLGVGHAWQALAYLVLSLVLGIFLAFAPESELTYALAPVYGAFGLLGFFGQLIIGIEGRVLPMFACTHANRFACGAGPVRLPHEISSRPLQALTFLGWTIGIPIFAFGMSRHSPSIVSAGGVSLLLAALSMTLNNARVLRHAFPRADVTKVPPRPAASEIPQSPD